MQENNLLNKNSTNDIQGVRSTYALVILISSIETENQLSYCGSTLEACWGSFHFPKLLSNLLTVTLMFF